MEVGSSTLPGTTKSIEDKRKGKTHKLIHSKLLPFGGLAQLARAPALQAGGHRFDPVHLHHALARKSDETVYGLIAQVVRAHA